MTISLEDMEKPKKTREEVLSFMYEFIDDGNHRLSKLFKKMSPKINFAYMPEGIIGGQGEEGIYLDVRSNLPQLILTAFHEIGHELDKKSDNHYDAEWRARRFEFNVAGKLRLCPTLLDRMTLAAGNDNVDKFKEYFDRRYGNREWDLQITF